jgi:hypothetical protein
MATPTQARVHHYVPQLYQRRFLQPAQTKYHYLDLQPDTVRTETKAYQRRNLLHWGPKRCFCKDDLYTVKLGDWTTDQVESSWFGDIDIRGKKAVDVFGDHDGSFKGQGEAVRNLMMYMDAQRIRTPRGLDQLKQRVDVRDHNATLLAMQRLFQFHETMWMEAVWEVARASQSVTKFIVSDDPVTFFNSRVFPGECPYPGRIELDQIGTRTIFPLGLNSCLILTHTQLVRNPSRANLTRSRANARSFEPAVIQLTNIQYGRELEEDEVLRINFILKKRATRYIAAAEEEWLYPELRVSTTDWSKLDDEWFLFPHPFKVPFTTEIVMGRMHGDSWIQDEYGRLPSNPEFKDKKLRDKERQTHVWAKKEWAKKRAGRSVAHVDKSQFDAVIDKMLKDYLAGISDIGE